MSKTPGIFMRASRGFTLIELVVGLVAFSVVMLIVSDVLVTQSSRSVDPVVQTRASELSQAMLNEIMAKKFDHQSAGNAPPLRCNERVACTAAGELGPESGETRATFDDVDDYHGYAAIADGRGLPITENEQDMYQGFSLRVVVFYDDNVDGTNDYPAGGSQTGNVKRISTYVTTPTDDTLVFTAYRWNY